MRIIWKSTQNSVVNLHYRWQQRSSGSSFVPLTKRPRSARQSVGWQTDLLMSKISTNTINNLWDDTLTCWCRKQAQTPPKIIDSSSADYTRHTLDGAACLLNSNKYFPSRVSIKVSLHLQWSLKHLQFQQPWLLWTSKSLNVYIFRRVALPSWDQFAGECTASSHTPTFITGWVPFFPSKYEDWRAIKLTHSI